MPLTRRNTVLFAVSTLLTGCLSQKESLLETGQSVDSGRRQFDAYFKKVGDLRDKVKDLDSDLFPLREPLTQELDVGEDASLPVLLEATRKRVAKLRDYGISINLQLTPQPRVITHQGDLEQDDKDASLPPAIQEAAIRSMNAFKEYQLMLEQAADLEAKRNELADKMETLPRTFTKRELLETELVAAGRVLAKAEQKLLRDTRTIGHFMIGLAAVSDTGARDGYDSKCDQAVAVFEEQEKKKAARKKRWAGRGRGRPRPRPRPRPRTGGGTPRPKPAPTPPTRPAGGGDFEM
jgi:hypothetical protein